MAQRLRGHLNKLKGSQKINLSAVGYKALVLDKSMSTAANEDVLIAVFGAKHSGMWNNKGFGPKVESLFIKMKTQLPFVFRYKLQDEVETRTVNLTGVVRQADRLLESAVKILDPGWQAAVLSYGMVVYKDNKVYKYAAQVFKSAS